ncbi:MAG: glutamate 5-kinase [bacterium]
MNKKIVIKLGSNILTTPKGDLDLAQIQHVAQQFKHISQTIPDLDLLLVSSGAITCGSDALQVIPETIPEKQAAASVGQILLMSTYARYFSAEGFSIGQILLTKEGLTHSVYSANIRNTLATLLAKGVVPIFNENDSVATDEIGERFGDNDELSGLVSMLIGAHKLIILSDTDGLFDKHPGKHNDARLLSEVTCVNEAILGLADDQDASHRNRGGMHAKLLTAQRCTSAGIQVHIANGRRPHVLRDILAERAVGTTFHVTKED